MFVMWDVESDMEIKYRVESQNGNCSDIKRNSAVCCYVNDLIRVNVTVTGQKAGFADSEQTSLSSLVRIPTPSE
jgi:hypothetical protein